MSQFTLCNTMPTPPLYSNNVGVIVFHRAFTILTNTCFNSSQRLLNTRANMIILHNKQLFKNETNFIWKIIINVIFIRTHINNKLGKRKSHVQWYDLSTVPFPHIIKKIMIPVRVDIWVNGKFKKGKFQ